jgi:hypothetical protein
MGAPTVTAELLAGGASSASGRPAPARVFGRLAVLDVNDLRQPPSGTQAAAARGPTAPTG